MEGPGNLILLWLLFPRMLLVRPHLLAALLGSERVGLGEGVAQWRVGLSWKNQQGWSSLYRHHLHSSAWRLLRDSHSHPVPLGWGPEGTTPMLQVGEAGVKGRMTGP